MKKATLSIVLALVSLVGFSQFSSEKIVNTEVIEVGKVRSAGITIAKIEYSIEESDTVYTLSFRNAEYTQINVTRSIKFSGGITVLNSLYDVMVGAIVAENPKEYKFMAKLGNENIIISGMKTLGISGVWIFTSKGHMAPINLNQLNKLFGKPVAEN